MAADKANKVKIMLIDDHPVVLNGLKNIMRDVSELEIISEATNGHNALLWLEDNKVDLIIVDINMPEMDGIELTKRVKEKYPDIKVLILTAFNEREILKNAFSSGAEGCLLKNTTKKELVRAIHKIIDNGYYYCNEILEIARSANSDITIEELKEVSLSKRELEVLELVLQGFSNKEIAEKLYISYHTVCSHRKNTMKKTESNNISGLFSYAQKCNLFPSLFEEK